MAKEIGDHIKALLTILPERSSELPVRRGDISAPFLKAMRALIARLQNAADELDPVRQPSGRIELFSPATIGRLIGRELASVSRIPLAAINDFYGAGVYTIYYTGDYEAYAAIRDTDCPIYVGKANPKQMKAVSPREQGNGLFSRLRKHRDNISKANNLELADFDCRYMVTESGWQMTAESFLISLYRPIWNKETKVCQGFGKHGDKARTELSKWDVLHAGRSWAENQKSRRGYTVTSVIQDIQAHFRGLLEEAPDFWSQELNPEWVSEHQAHR